LGEPHLDKAVERLASKSTDTKTGTSTTDTSQETKAEAQDLVRQLTA
jgi:hypothetical protein